MRPEVIAVLEPGYDELFDHVLAVCRDDERVRALWLGGSLARGTADAVSDLDVLIAVADVDAFAPHWREWLARIAPTVIAHPLPFLPGSFYSVTPERLRLDVIVEAASAVPHTFFRQRLLVFDRDALVVPPPDATPGPSQDRISSIIEEFFRDYGMFPVAVEREDWLLSVEAVHLIRSLLYQLFVEENAPLPMMGVKQWSAKLTARQRDVLLSLPTGGSDRDELISAHERLALVFVAEARRVAAAHDVSWPTELEACTRAYLARWNLPTLEGS